MRRDGHTMCLHHVGVVLNERRQLDELLTLLGLAVSRCVFVERYQAECLFVNVGTAQVEFIVPQGGPLAGFNRGVGGLHHLAFQVNNLEKLQDRLAAGGIHLLEDRPVPAGELRINFLPPVYTRGLILEFVEPNGPGRTASGAV